MGGEKGEGGSEGGGKRKGGGGRGRKGRSERDISVPDQNYRKSSNKHHIWLYDLTPRLKVTILLLAFPSPVDVLLIPEGATHNGDRGGHVSECLSKIQEAENAMSLFPAQHGVCTNCAKATGHTPEMLIVYGF